TCSTLSAAPETVAMSASITSVGAAGWPRSTGQSAGLVSTSVLTVGSNGLAAMPPSAPASESGESIRKVGRTVKPDGKRAQDHGPDERVSVKDCPYSCTRLQW